MRPMDLKTQNIGSFFLTLHILTSAGETLVTALTSAKDILPVESHPEVDRIVREIDTGVPIDVAFANVGFPKSVASIIKRRAFSRENPYAFAHLQVITDRLRKGI